MRRYRLVRSLVRRTFASLARVAAQNQEYANRFIRMGVPAERVMVTGTMKWDTAEIAADVEGSAELAHEMGIDRSKPLVVAGSTAPGEPELLVAATPDYAQLLCAPRRPEWFEQAAQAMPGCIRRSKRASPGRSTDPPRLFLLDTIGELRKAYALADVAVVGRSFGSLHGSDMMEPVALGKATITGPAVSDFEETVQALLAGDGLVQTTAGELPRVIADLLANAGRRAQLAANGRDVVAANQGATAHHIALITELLRPGSSRQSGHEQPRPAASGAAATRRPARKAKKPAAPT